ncbi:MAG: hypothetical protein HYS81_00630 [Candidatus Aenigmatarchaeota archaeon]|nr:MAG: hypothetical protein HYS81_00630 [Candidatus Aenigmarchaeota archaeon]
MEHYDFSMEHDEFSEPRSRNGRVVRAITETPGDVLGDGGRAFIADYARDVLKIDPSRVNYGKVTIKDGTVTIPVMDSLERVRERRVMLPVYASVLLNTDAVGSYHERTGFFNPARDRAPPVPRSVLLEGGRFVGKPQTEEDVAAQKEWELWTNKRIEFGAGVQR